MNFSFCHKIYKPFLSLVFLVTFFIVSIPGTVFAWDNIAGGDHGGADWHITSSTDISGAHTNVGTFTVDTGVIVTIRNFDGSNYGTVSISAQSVLVNGSIIGDGAGYAPVRGTNGLGPGGGIGSCTNYYAGGGGTYGGSGGQLTQNSYGSLFQPTSIGSAGGGGQGAGACHIGGYGGGSVTITSSGSFIVTGKITVNGTVPTEISSGGGSGGSLFLTANSFSGIGGTLSANGGNGTNPGGSGGGGRIAIHYSDPNTDLSRLIITANPGPVGTVGQNGTLVIVDEQNKDLYVNTTQTWHSNIDGSVYNFRNIIVTSPTLKLIGYNSNDSDGLGFNFNVTNFSLSNNSKIDMDGGGYRAATQPSYNPANITDGFGPGAGLGRCTDYYTGGGGSHGGLGGSANKGGINDNIFQPTFLGSGGGGGEGSYTCYVGGAGGGAIKINASNLLTLNGSISANGAPGMTISGGGAGGSIYLIANKILTVGSTLSANGGAGVSGAGNGGGGRIALYYSDASSSLPSTSVAAGSGGTGGGIGTVFSFKYYDSPTNLTQYRQDGITVINSNSNTPDHEINLKYDLSNYAIGSTLTPQIEVQKISDNFTNLPNLQISPFVYTGTTTVSLNYPNNPNWALSDWSKRESFTLVNEPATSISNLQLSITVPYQSSMKANFDDIRFTDSNGQPLSFWLESKTDASYAKYWVKFPYIPPTSSTQYYIYYGNSSASSLSNGTNTFEFFDDFNGSSIDQSKWIIDDGTGFSLSNGNLVGTNTLGRIKSVTSYSTNKIAEFKVNTTSFSANGMGMGYFVSSVNDFGILSHNTTSYYRTDGTWVQIGTPIPTSKNLLYSFKTISSTQVNYSVYNLDTSSWTIAPATVTNTVSSEPVALGKRFDDAYTGETYNTQWDWVRVRNYISSEPTYSISSEESKPTLSLVDLTGYRWQARVCNQSGFCSSWTTFDSDSNPDFSILYDILPPVSNASNVGFSQADITTGNWTGKIPSIKWSAASDNPGGSGMRGYCVSLVETNPGVTATQIDPCSDDGILPGNAPLIVEDNKLDLSTLTGLTLNPNKQYWFSIKSIDKVGNIFLGASDGSDYSNVLSFKYDNALPTNVTSISAISGSYSSTSDFYFSWPISGQLAASDAGSGILGFQYSIGDTGNWHGSDTNGLFGITYLPIGTSQPYFLPTTDSQYVGVGANTIYFRTVDNAGNFSPTSTYRTALISFGGNAPSFPTNSAVSVNLLDTSSSKPKNLFNVSWPAAKAYQGNHIYKYFYMVNTTPPLNYNTIKSNSAVYIGVGDTGLSSIELPNIHRGSNFIYVVAVDDNKDAQNQLSPNYSPSNTITASFDFNSDLPDPPLNVIVSDSSIKTASVWRASIAWDKPAYGGTGSLSFSIERSSDGIIWTPIGTTSGYSYLDTVPKSQKYYWRVGSFDNSDDSKTNPSFANAVTLIPKGTYTTPPDLTSGPSIYDITTKKAEITWSTSRVADSKVAFGTEAGKYFNEEPSNSLQVSEHTINLTNLLPGTTYYYIAKWTDEDGNTGTTAENSFTTDPKPSIKEAIAKSISISSALIQFTSLNASKAKVYYGKTTAFGGVKEIATGTNESTYTNLIEGLEDGTKYYFKINTYDSENNEYEGDTNSFETLPRPKITQVKIQQIPGTAQSTLLITWQSNTEVSSIISFAPQSDPSASRDELDTKLSKGEHKMLLKGLTPNTVYTMAVRGRDKVGNEAISDRFPFTTATDTRPPQLFDVAVQGTNVPAVSSAGQSASSQLIISWTTDEPSTSQVEYGEGSGTTYQQKTQEDENLTLNHVVIISNLTPSKVYHLRAIAKDKALNSGNSIDTVTITPKATDNALDLVVTNLSQAFSFLNKIK